MSPEQLMEKLMESLEGDPDIDVTPYDEAGRGYILDFSNGEAVLVQAENYESLEERMTTPERPRAVSEKLPLWTVYAQAGTTQLSQRIRAASRDEAVAQSRFAEKDRMVWDVWASWKCDCGC